MYNSLVLNFIKWNMAREDVGIEIIEDDLDLANWITILNQALNGAFLLSNGSNPFPSEVVYIALPASDIPNRAQFRSVIETLLKRCKHSRNLGLGTCIALPTGADPSSTFKPYEATVFLRWEIEEILKELGLEMIIEFTEGDHSFMISRDEFARYSEMGFPDSSLPMVEES
jgi:hypothetical protein